MGHNLNTSNGKASMFYVGETPWHKLGTKLDNPATAQEALEAAHLNYTVERCPILSLSRSNKLKDVLNHYATIRSDTEEVLGLVGSRYEIIQNRDAFSFFDALVGLDQAIYHTAGALGKGERIWILAKLPDYIRVGKNDVVEKFLLLTNSHDGSSLACAKLTPIRVVCSNTLSAALDGSEQEVRIRHTPNAPAKLEEAHKLLGLTNKLYEDLGAIFNRMALSQLSERQLIEYVNALIPSNPDAENHARTEKARNIIRNLHEFGQGAEMSKGTLWGAYNAVAEYTDHINRTENDSKQLKNIWFGSGERLKRRAFALASSIMNN